ncbi:MAG TPA: outer membrane lipoprotein-sorting protein [Terriglobales bacterium]|nr:outer membrane lipoprotein-sorting protein [Terriglobales bacterium]
MLAANRTATLQEMVDYMNAQAAKIQTLNSTVDIDTSVGGSKKGKVTEYQQIRGYILVRKPDLLRMIGLFPVVRNRAFDMVSDANGFKLYIPAKNRFIIGPPDVVHPSANPLENLRPQVIYNALLIRAVDPNNEIAILEQSAEVVNDVTTKRIEESPTYVVDVIHKGDKGWYLSRKVIFSRGDLLPHRQLIYDLEGNLVTEAKYEGYKDFNGTQYPTDIDIWRPSEEYSIGITVVKLTVDQPLKDDQFTLEQPSGVQVVHLDSENNQVSQGGDPEKK